MRTGSYPWGFRHRRVICAAESQLAPEVKRIGVLSHGNRSSPCGALIFFRPLRRAAGMFGACRTVMHRLGCST
jgi:hypothetical protein